MIDNEGRLLTAIPDECGKYDPIKSKPTGVVSNKGPLFKCKNLCVKASNPTGCLWCINRAEKEA